MRYTFTGNNGCDKLFFTVPLTEEGVAVSVKGSETLLPEASTEVVLVRLEYPVRVTFTEYALPAETVAAKVPSLLLTVVVGLVPVPASVMAIAAFRIGVMPSDTSPVIVAVFGTRVKVLPVLRCPGPTVTEIVEEMNPGLDAVTFHVPG